MSRKIFHTPLFIEVISLFFIVAVLHVLAIYHNLYWEVGEYDSMMHFLGGAFVVIGVLWLYFFSGFFNPLKRQIRQYLLVSLLGLIFISVAWEIFELVYGVTFVNAAEYSFDTALDFVMDFLGGIAACFYAYMKEIPNIKGQPPENLPI